MNAFLDLIEKRLETLIEGSLDRLFIKYASGSLAQQLSFVVKNNVIIDSNGLQIAPDILTILIAPEKLPEWVESQDFLDELAHSIFQSAQEMGFAFHAHPRIIPAVSDILKGESFELQATFSPPSEPMSETSVFSTLPIDQKNMHTPKNAYIVVNGRTTYPLEKSLVNIGRRSNCDIILEDPQVSRDHVQLRAYNNRFILFDLGSTGGTFLNGQPCQSAILNSGDVIRIGSSFLIYSQDMTDGVPTTTKFDIA
jgi:hypothetical protein